MILAIAVANGWRIDQVDVKGAFLHASLPPEDKIYMHLPTLEFMPSISGRIVKLLKSLYGLRHAPKLWYKHFSEEVTKLDFQRSMASDCLFISNLPSGRAYIVVYVDDLLIVRCKQAVAKVKKLLADIFTITDLGE